MCNNSLANPVIPAIHIANGVSNADFLIYVNLMYNPASVFIQIFFFEKISKLKKN